MYDGTEVPGVEDGPAIACGVRTDLAPGSPPKALTGLPTVTGLSPARSTSDRDRSFVLDDMRWHGECLWMSASQCPVLCLALVLLVDDTYFVNAQCT